MLLAYEHSSALSVAAAEMNSSLKKAGLSENKARTSEERRQRRSRRLFSEGKQRLKN